MFASQNELEEKTEKKINKRMVQKQSYQNRIKKQKVNFIPQTVIIF